VPSTERVVLELVSDEEPIAGTLIAAGHPPAHFQGYVQLISALQAVRPTREPEPPSRPA